jgi:hypothetical protein
MLKKRSVWPQNSNRSSTINHPCLRYLTYSRTHWQVQSLPSLNLQYVFEEGNNHEKTVLRLLEDSGFTLIEQQRAFSFEKFNITGHLDAKIVVSDNPQDHAIPLEIKSSEPYFWSKVESSQDFANSKKVWHINYLGQMQMYIASTYGIEGEELGKIKCKVPDGMGIMIIKNKLNGRLKQVNFVNNDDFLNDILHKATIVNDHVKNETLPDAIEPDENICGRCNFKSLCIPEVSFDEVLSIEENQYLLGLLEERQAIMPVYRRYNEIDKEVKLNVKGKSNSLLGQFHITGKTIKKKGFEVKPGSYWKANIRYLGDKQNG